MYAQKNPLPRGGGSLIVRHPDSGTPFPEGVFELSAEDAANPRVRRLFASSGREGGLAGGVYGDLHIAPAPTKDAKK